jgi:malignant T-cell-amplified sequence
MSTDKSSLDSSSLIHLFKQSSGSGQLKKWVLSRRDSTDLVERLESSLGLTLNLPKSAQANCAEPEDGIVFVGLDSLEFVQAGEKFFPYLGSQGTLALFPGAVVDEGAIKFLLNGADVMRPGVRAMDDWGGAGKMVVVREEKKGRAVAVGPSMVTSSEARDMKKGPCIKNAHHVGDRYWNLHKSL